MTLSLYAAKKQGILNTNQLIRNAFLAHTANILCDDIHAITTNIIKITEAAQGNSFHHLDGRTYSTKRDKNISNKDIFSNLYSDKIKTISFGGFYLNRR